MYLLRQLPPVLAATLLLSLCCCGQAPPNQFHGRAQSSSLDSFFERALGLVNEVNRLPEEVGQPSRDKLLPIRFFAQHANGGP